ncbi:MAG: hypothetical protein AAF492_12630, partial [Verrucomicrobiota bacterium]
MNTRPRKLFAKTLLALGSMLLTMLTFVNSVQAIDPEPDYWTLIFPTLVPKAGQGPNPPADSASGLIRVAYEGFFEDYWKESSYFQHDPATGLKEFGFFSDSKTYGYVNMPWPITSRTNVPNSFRGQSAGNLLLVGEAMRQFGDCEPIAEFGNNGQLYEGEMQGDNPLIDGVWTPGESFIDANGDGRWTDLIPAVPDEDYWNVDIPWGPFGPFVNTAGQTITPLVFSNTTMNGTSGNWSPTRGEFFADYNGSANPSGGVVGFDMAVDIFVAIPGGNENVTLTMNELDITPDAASPNSDEGDFDHSYVDNGDPGGQADIPMNNQFDYNIDGSSGMAIPLIAPAVDAGGATFVVTYDQYQLNGQPYQGPPTNGLTLVTITVPVYQSGELFHMNLGPNVY